MITSSTRNLIRLYDTGAKRQFHGSSRQSLLFRLEPIIQNSRAVDFFGTEPEGFAEEFFAVFEPINLDIFAAVLFEDLRRQPAAVGSV